MTHPARTTFAAIAGIPLLLILASAPGIAAPGDTTLVTDRLPGQTSAASESGESRVTPSGRYFVFTSWAADLVPDDTNRSSDIFLVDRQSGSIERVSVSSGSDEQADGSSSFPSVSADGRFVAFASSATNLVANDTNDSLDLFVRDRQAGTTQRLDVDLGTGTPLASRIDPSVSGNGRYVVFSQSLSTGIFVYDRHTGLSERVSVSSGGASADGQASSPSISANGRWVAFASSAVNLVGSDTNGDQDVFVRDRQTGVTERVSVDSAEAQVEGSSLEPALSADGSFVAFSSFASTLVPGDSNGTVDVFVRDRQLGTTERASVSSSEVQGNSESRRAVISSDGLYLAFESLASNLAPGGASAPDVFLRDRQAGTTLRISVDSGGVKGDGESTAGAVSANGRFVAFNSLASNLVGGDRNAVRDVFLFDRQATGPALVSTLRIESVAGGGFNPAFSADGRFVAFASSSANLVPGDTNNAADIFVADRLTGAIERVSESSAGAQANDRSNLPALSADGRFVAFESNASNLVANDANFHGSNVFVHDRQSGATEIITSSGGAGQQGGVPAISADGRFVAFQSENPQAGLPRVFVRDRQDGSTEQVSVDSSGNPSDNSSFGASMSADGRFVAFRSFATNLVPNDLNGSVDVFVHDRQLDATSRVSVDSSGTESNADSFTPYLSANGRFVAFGSLASNLATGDGNELIDTFVHDLQNGTTARVSLDSGGGDADGNTDPGAISADGRFVVLVSSASDLVENDTNDSSDAFVRDRSTGTTERVSADSAGAQGNRDTEGGAISGDGRYVAFNSQATNLGVVDLNDTDDIFIRERSVSTTSLTVSPQSIAFGNQPRSTTSAPRAVTVTNITASPVAITGVRLVGSNPNQFAQSHNCGASLAAGASCTVQVVFKPTSLGAKSTTLNVNGGGGGLRAVALTGRGT